MDMELLFFGGILLVGLAYAVGFFFMERRRAAQLEETATRLSMTFVKKEDESRLAAYASFSLFGKGRGKKIVNNMEKQVGEMELACFEYHYTTGNGKNSKTHRQSVVSVGMSGAFFPSFELEPENMMHKIRQVFGGQDIEFENHPEFTKMFRLQGADEEAVRRLFSSQVIRSLEESKGLFIEASGNTIVFYKKGRRSSASQVETLIGDSLSTYALFLKKGL